MLFHVRIGDHIFDLDIPAVDAWIVARSLLPATIATLAATRARAVHAFEQGRMDEVERTILEWYKDVRTPHSAPLVSLGRKFTTGRKPGRLSPVAKRIKAYLLKHPEAKSLDVWKALAAAPPRGYDFRDNFIGRYIEVGAETVMVYPRFRNLVSEHRPKQ
jgi:hypothetical protein